MEYIDKGGKKTTFVWASFLYASTRLPNLIFISNIPFNSWDLQRSIDSSISFLHFNPIAPLSIYPRNASKKIKSLGNGEQGLENGKKAWKTERIIEDEEQDLKIGRGESGLVGEVCAICRRLQGFHYRKISHLFQRCFAREELENGNKVTYLKHWTRNLRQLKKAKVYTISTSK